jgi:catalase-peroxidase
MAVDFDEVKDDIRKVLVDSQDWWPADYGHYGPFFVRLVR